MRHHAPRLEVSSLSLAGLEVREVLDFERLRQFFGHPSLEAAIANATTLRDRLAPTWGAENLSISLHGGQNYGAEAIPKFRQHGHRVGSLDLPDVKPNWKTFYDTAHALLLGDVALAKNHVGWGRFSADSADAAWKLVSTGLPLLHGDDPPVMVRIASSTLTSRLGDRVIDTVRTHNAESGRQAAIVTVEIDANEDTPARYLDKFEQRQTALDAQDAGDLLYLSFDPAHHAEAAHRHPTHEIPPAEFFLEALIRHGRRIGRRRAAACIAALELNQWQSGARDTHADPLGGGVLDLPALGRTFGAAARDGRLDDAVAPRFILETKPQDFSVIASPRGIAFLETIRTGYLGAADA